jgi:CopG family nickel-responsive transcriptional regulator
MVKIKRFGISMEEDLLEKLDFLIKKRGYKTRSEALRDFTREQLVRQEWKNPNQQVIGTLTLVYNHHARMLSDKLADIQHHHHGKIIASTHVHLDEHNCAEVVIIRGRSADVQEIADQIISTKGVKHGKLVMSTTGKEV